MNNESLIDEIKDIIMKWERGINLHETAVAIIELMGSSGVYAGKTGGGSATRKDAGPEESTNFTEGVYDVGQSSDLKSETVGSLISDKDDNLASSTTYTLIRKRFNKWLEAYGHCDGESLWDAWQAAWIVSNDLTISIMNAGSSSEIPVNEAWSGDSKTRIPVPTEAEFYELIHKKRQHVKPTREAQEIRNKFELDTGKYNQPDADFLPDYIWDFADIIAQMALNSTKRESIDHIEDKLGMVKEAIELLQEWHDLHCESNRRLDADDTYARTQAFLMNNEIEGDKS